MSAMKISAATLGVAVFGKSVMPTFEDKKQDLDSCETSENCATQPDKQGEVLVLPSAVSRSIKLLPADHRCKHWAKIYRAEMQLPIPAEVHGAGDLLGKYIKGDEELYPGDVAFEGEAVHHSKKRGWDYCITYCTDKGELLRFWSGFSEQRTAAKAAGLPANLLAGSGDIAGAVRVAHALRLNIHLPGGENL